MHKLTASGEKIDDATLAKYLTYNRGAKRTKRPTESKPSTSGVARAAKTTPDQPAEYPQPDNEDRPTSATSNDPTDRTIRKPTSQPHRPVVAAVRS